MDDIRDLGMCACAIGMVGMEESGNFKFILVEFASKSKNCNSLN
jgi:hypothetical protein